MGIIYFSGSEGQLYMQGLSSDTKPAEPIDNWTFNEIDTGKFYYSVNTDWTLVVNTIYSSTASYYIVGSASVGNPFSKILKPGSSVTIHTDSTSFYVNATTSAAVAAPSGGLAGTGLYYIVSSAQPLLPNSRILTAGSSITVRTDTTAFYIDAVTSLYAGSAGLASTGGLYVVTSASPLFANSRILTAGTSVSIRTDATSIIIDSPNKDFNYWYTANVGSAMFLNVKGRVYVAGMANALALGATIIPINSACCVPFVTTRDIAIDTMGYVATIAGSVTCLAQLGIYSNSADNVLYPFQAISTSGVTVTGSGAASLLNGYNPGITLTNNTLYWLCYFQNKSAQTLRTIAVGGAWPIFGMGTDMGTAPGLYLQIPMVGLTTTGFAATMPTGGNIIATAPPALAVRVNV